MALNEYMREFIAHVTQYCEYIEDAVVSPELCDFSVILSKTQQVRRMVPFIEGLIGIHRQENKGHAGQPNSATKHAQEKIKAVSASPPRGKASDRQSSRTTKKARSR